MKKLYDISKKYPILVGVVGLLVIYLSFMNTPSTPDQNSYKLSVLKIILTIACTGFIALIGPNRFDIKDAILALTFISILFSSKLKFPNKCKARMSPEDVIGSI